MSILYLDCSMGAAGDMLTAALLELLPDKKAFLEELNAMGLPHTQVSAESSAKCGIQGTHISVRVHGAEEGEEHHHHHSEYREKRAVKDSLLFTAGHVPCISHIPILLFRGSVGYSVVSVSRHQTFTSFHEIGSSGSIFT